MNNTIHAESPVKTGAQHRALKYLNRYILVMKLSAILIFLVCMTASAASHAQKVNLQARNESLINVLREITKQSGYNFVIKEEHLSKAVPVTLSVHGQDATQVIAAVFASQPFTYEIKGKVVSIKPKPILNSEPPQQSTVRGRVTDSLGNGLEGVIVEIPGTQLRTATDKNGYYALDEVVIGVKLSFRHLGYKTVETIINRPEINIILSPVNARIDEVVINTGYWKVSKKFNTGNISRVSSETIAKQPIGNPLAAMIGRMPGVMIEQQSGLNGGGFKIEIRGQNSLRTAIGNNGNQPLYLIDGVPYPSASITEGALAVGGISQLASPLSAINPNDIESIEILKDADATAIYGSRGANGVILITTKRPKETGKATYTIRALQGFSEISTKLDLLSPSQYFEMREEAFQNDGVNPGITDYDLNGTWDSNSYKNWQKELIGGKSPFTDLSASINSGNESIQFSARANYNKQSTVIPGDFANEKGSLALAANHTSLNKKFRAYFSSTYFLDNNKLPRRDVTQYINLPPNAPDLFVSEGKLNWGINESGAATWVNPLAVTREPYDSMTNTFISSGNLEYDIVPGITAKTNIGYTSIKFRESLLSPISAQNPAFNPTGFNQLSMNSINILNIEPQVTYRKQLNQTAIDVLAGATLQSSFQKGETITASGYTSDLQLGNIAAAPQRFIFNNSNEYKYLAAFGRININHKSRYIVNITGRRDGSSRFGPEKQFANFGAIGAVWLFHAEPFVKKSLPFLSFGKLRSSFGITGNDQIPDYGYLETFSSTQSYLDGSGLFPDQIGNAEYSWETNKKFEAAMDLGFLNDRIFFNASWYRNRSSNQLVGYALPNITGFPTIQYNLPATVQNTGWEMELDALNISRKNISWRTSINLTIPSNKLISYPNIEGSSYANTYTVGESLYKTRRYNYLGVDPQTGVYRFEDTNGNGLIEISDRRSTGKPLTSHFYGGLNNSISYKNFSVDLFFQFVNKTVLNPYTTAQFSLPGSLNNQLDDVLNRWQTPGDTKPFQRFSQSYGANGSGSQFSNLFFSNRFSDASFIRLKNVALLWNIPESWNNVAGTRRISIFLNGQNLLTFTKYPGDPEVVNLKSLPTMRTYTAGIQIDF